jgi:hypothetical protein
MARHTTNLEKRIGSDEFKRLGAKGMQDPTKRNQYSAAEVISEFRQPGGSKVNEGDDSVKQRFLDAQAGGAKFNLRAQQYLTDKHGFNFGAETKDPVEEKTPVTPKSQKKAQDFKDDKMEKAKDSMPKETSKVDSTGIGASGISSHESIADRYSSKIDADFAKDEADFNVQDMINSASENVQSKVNADDRFKGLYQSVTNMSDYYRNSSDRTRLGIFGDMWNTRSSSWKSPGSPEKIETNYDKD